jgi:hypothetical protein
VEQLLANGTVIDRSHLIERLFRRERIALFEREETTQ